MSGLETKSDERLVADYARGDRSALEELVRRHWAEAHRIALRVLGDGAAAEDAAQDSFVNLIRGAKRFEEGRKFGPWFGAIVMNSARQRSRSERTRKRYEERASKERANAVAPLGETRAIEAEVEEHFQKLSFDVRFPLALHFYEGRTYDEVGEVLGCQKSTAHSRIGRGLEQLRASLAGAGCAVAIAALEAALASSGSKPVVTPHAPFVSTLEAAARKATLGVAVAKGAAALLALVLIVAGIAGATGEPPRNPAESASAAPIPSVATTEATAASPAPALDAPPPPREADIASSGSAAHSTGAGGAAVVRGEEKAPAGAVLDVLVHDFRGQPVEGAMVQFIEAKMSERKGEAPDSRGWFATLVTDEHGRARIDSEHTYDEKVEDGRLVIVGRIVPLATGKTVWVFARRGLEEGFAGPFDLVEPVETPVKVDLRKPAESRKGRGSLLATVTKDGLLLREGEVSGEWDAVEGARSSRIASGRIDTRTDAEGRLLVLDLRPGRYRFAVKSRDGAFVSFEEKIETDRIATHEIAITEGAACEGTLTFAPGLRPEDVNNISGYRKGRSGLESVSGVVLPDGRWRFEHLAAGEYRVSVVLERGFATVESSFTVPASGLVQGPEIRVGFGARVTGRAVDRHGAPLRSFASLDVSGDGLHVSSADVDADGRFTIGGVPPGSYVVKLRPERKDQLRFDVASFDRVANVKVVVADGSQVVDVGDVTFPVESSPWKLAGRVVDAKGQPVAGADIELVRPGGWPLTKTQTDAGGCFTVEEEKPGVVVVAARLADRVSPPRTFETRSGTTEDAVLELTERTGRLTGRFVAPADVPGKAVVRLTALCERESPSGGRYPFTSRTAKLDEQGRFAFEDLPPGEYKARIISVTSSEKVEVTPGREASVLLDWSHATETVKVTVEGELPERHGQIHVSFDATPGKAGGQIVHGIEDGGSEFRHVAAGRFKAEVHFAESSNTRLYMAKEGTVSQGQPAALTFRWPARETTGTVRGKVRVRPKGEVLVWALGREVSCFRMIETDDTFHLTGLPEGDYRLVLSEDEPPASAAGKSVRVEKGAEVEVVLGD